MSTETCLITPAYERFRVYKQSHLEFCEGNACAAGLIDFFERWHMKKLAIAKKNQRANDIAEMHGEQRTHDESLYQHHTQKELRIGLLAMFSERTISKAVNYLETEKKIISIHRNPVPRYHFDKTNHYLFYPEVFNDWLKREGLVNDAECVNTAETSNEDVGAPTTPAPTEPELPAVSSQAQKSIIDTADLPHREAIVAIDTDNLPYRSTDVCIDAENLPHRESNVTSRDGKFTSAIYNKTTNKTKESLNLTQPSIHYRNEPSSLKSSSVDVVSEVNFDITKNKQSTLPSQTQTANPADDVIHEQLSDPQLERVKQVVNTLTKQGRVSNPQQLQDEFIFTLLDKHILDRCHHSFSKKLNAMANLVETKRWSTPIRLQYVRQQQASKHQSTDTNVVTLNTHQRSELANSTTQSTLVQQQTLTHEIHRLTTEIAGENALLLQMQGTPDFAALQRSVNKTITQHQQAIKQCQAQLEALTVATQTNRARAAQ